ncbi:MAG: YceI family protein [Solirubrobacterales bacterium]|nr:YceI family protein [Solirubrobacterales bacterium]
MTRPLRLTVDAHGNVPDQFGNERVGLHATGELQRSEFGMPYDQRVAGIPHRRRHDLPRARRRGH